MNVELSNGVVLDVVIIRKKNKNVYFRVKDDLKVYVTCPIYLSKNSIESIIEENKSSIEKLYEKVNKVKISTEENANMFYYLGNKYNIVIDESISTVTFKDDNVYTKSEDMLQEFYDSEVVRVFNEEVNIAKKCFSTLPEFSLKFKCMKSRWGVCNHAKNIVTLNTELLKRDITLLDYVIIHELCHFYEHNHSKNFWNLVSQAYPNYKEARRALRNDYH